MEDFPYFEHKNLTIGKKKRMNLPLVVSWTPAIKAKAGGGVLIRAHVRGVLHDLSS